MVTRLNLGLLFLLFFAASIFGGPVFGAHQIEYGIEVHTDNSASWVIEHRFLLETDDDEMIFRRYSNWSYFSDYFIENVTALMNTAKLKTGRESMAVENFKMTIDVFDSYRVVRYEFDWREFAEGRGERIIIGDVFEVEGLFLHGNGELNMFYPAEYVIESVSPEPNAEADRTVTWYEVQEFDIGKPRVVLDKKTASILHILKSNVHIIIALVVLVGVTSSSIWFLKFRKKGKVETASVTHIPVGITRMEDDEEKVISLLKSAGGRLLQSTLVSQCGFSRSKTSKLLTSMETRGRIRRQKRGREKVVTLASARDARNKARSSH